MPHKDEPDRERRRCDPEDPFGLWDMDQEFERMRRYMDRVFSDALREGLDELPERPFVYGFSMRVGPDGRPRIEEFGNVPQLASRGQDDPLDSREPLTDVIECDDSISITAEMPGVEKKDVDLRVSKDSVTISVEGREPSYFKRIELPAEVEPESTKATCKNGILDITLHKAAKKAPNGRRIKVD